MLRRSSPPRPLAVASFASLALAVSAAAPAQVPADREAEEGPRLFVTDRTAERQLRLAKQALADDRVTDAAALVRLALGRGADGVNADGVSTSAAAAALLNGLTGRQREALELAAGAEADRALEAARAAGDRAALASVAADFPGTAAAARAAAAVADGDLDRGDFPAAARRFARLAALPFPPAADRDRWAVKGAAALARSGRPAEARAALDALPPARLAAAAGSLFGTPAEDPAALLARLAGPGTASAEGWPLVGRTPRRLPAAPGVPAPAAVNLVGGPAWREGTLAVVPPNPLDGPADRLLGRVRVDRAATRRSVRPAARPAAAGGAVYAATPGGGVVARDAATGGRLWDAPAGADSALALATAGEAPESVSVATRHRGTVTGTELLVEAHAFADPAAGAVAVDAARVYSVQNLDFPLLSLDDARASAGGRIGRPVDRRRRDRANRLRAHDRRTGKLLWVAGGPAPGTVAGGFAGGGATEENPLAGGFFLSAPLPTGSGLAVLHERGGLVSVLTLDPATGAVRRATPLAVPPLPRYEAPPWRTAGLHLAAAAGLWVAPTAAGGAAAVDALTGRVVWTARYAGTFATERDAAAAARSLSLGGVPVEPGWHGAAPKLAAGRALLTPSDSDDLHCLDLADGTPLWTRPRGSDREVVGVTDSEGDAAAATVLLAGDDGVRGVSLADGSELWFVPLPPAAGSAVVAGGAVVVPLVDGTLSAVRTDGTGVAARSPAGGPGGRDFTPGNLIAAGGRLVSQGPDALAAFATVAETEARATTAAADPGGTSAADAALLRAGLAFQRGEPARGAEELIVAAHVPGTPGRRAAAALRARLAAGLRRDFAAFRPLRDRAAAAGVPVGGEVARALAAGLLDAGEPAGAAAALLELRDEADVRKPRRGGRFVSADAFVGPRLAAAFTACGPAERATLADGINELAAAIDTADATAAARFARRHGATCRSAAWRARGAPDPVAAVLLGAAEAAKRRGDFGGAERLLLWADDRDPVAVPDEWFVKLYDAAGATRAAAAFAPPAAPPWAGRAVVAESAGRGERLYADAVVPVEAWPPGGVGGRLTAGEADAALTWRTPDGAVGFRSPLRGRIDRTGVRAAFAGHLLAAAVAGRLTVLDALAAPGAAKRLWSARLGAAADRGGVRFPGVRRSGGSGASPNAGAATRDGPAAVGPPRVVIRDGDTLAARDARTGAVLWTRDGVPDGAAVWGDDRFVLVGANGAGRVARFRGADGEPAGAFAAPAGSALLRRGTSVWTVRSDPGRGAEPLRVARVDFAPGPSGENAGEDETPAAPAVAWERAFPAGTVMHLADACDELFVLEPGGRFSVVTLATGADAHRADLCCGGARASGRCGRTPSPPTSPSCSPASNSPRNRRDRPATRRKCPPRRRWRGSGRSRRER